MANPETPSSTENKLLKLAIDHVQNVFRGNGIKKENITLISHQIAHHTMNAGTYLELKPIMNERHVPGKIVAGQLTGSRDEAMRAVDQSMRQAASDPAAKAQMTQILLSRNDQGFGLNGLAVPLDFLKKEFTWHEACHVCKGTTKSPCIKCQGRKLETCFKCTGRGLMKCPMCRATGLLQGNKCPRCHAQRYVACDGCRRSGMMPCRTCNALGVMKCQTCAGHGWKTHIMTLQAQALTYFEYDAKSIPKGAADAIEVEAAKIAAEKKIEIKGRIADDKENVLGASYEVSFPYGEVVFGIGKREAKANLFGFHADLVGFPFVLDKILGPSVIALEEAAKNVGDVAQKIQGATRFRLIAQAFIASHRMSVKKTAEQLLKNFDVGLSPGMAEKIAALSDRTSSHITRKPRHIGLVLGLILTAFLDAAYYLLPVRTKIASFLPAPQYDFILDALLVFLGGFITTIIVQMMAAGAMQKALGHLYKNAQKTRPSAKTHGSALWAYIGAGLIAFVMMEIAAQQGGSPYWYEIIRTVIVR